MVGRILGTKSPSFRLPPATLPQIICTAACLRVQRHRISSSNPTPLISRWLSTFSLFFLVDHSSPHLPLPTIEDFPPSFSKRNLRNPSSNHRTANFPYGKLSLLRSSACRRLRWSCFPPLCDALLIAGAFQLSELTPPPSSSCLRAASLR